MDNEPIRFCEMVGIPEEKLKEYTVRLNRAFFFDIVTEYYTHPEHVMGWIFKKKWSGSKRSTNHMLSKVLQFVQLKADDSTKWVFLGAYLVSDVYVDDEGDESYHYEEDLHFHPYVARTIVNFKVRAGKDQGFVFNVGNDQERLNHFWDNMLVDSITEKPVSSMPFPGYHNVRLTLKELSAALNYNDWQAALGAVKAIYLQTDTLTGWHYVGSAYGEHGSAKGLLGRWRDYAEGNHTGGNDRLRKLVEEKGPNYIPKYFRYSILETFDMKEKNSVIINREHWWMETLSSVYDPESPDPHGYNSKLQFEHTGNGEIAGTN